MYVYMSFTSTKYTRMHSNINTYLLIERHMNTHSQTCTHIYYTHTLSDMHTYLNKFILHIYTYT